MIRLFLLFLTAALPLTALPRVPVRQVARNNNGFALALYSEMIKGQGRNNLVIAPYALSSAMAIAYLGAKEETVKEIADHFIYPLDPMYMGESFKSINQNFLTDKALGLASALWVQEGIGIKDEFLSRVNKYYEGDFHQVDFEIKTDSSRNEINSWVSARTHKKIPNLLDIGDFPRGAKMFLVACMTLQAGWETPFNIRDTSSANFYISPENQRMTPFMHVQGEYPYYENEEVKVVEIPYAQLTEGQSTRLGFWIVLPKGPGGLKELEESLSINKFSEWWNQATKKLVSLKMPRFRIYQMYDFKEQLEKLGLKAPFGPEANFSSMTDASQVFLSKIIQKTTFHVDERGTDASHLNTNPLTSQKKLVNPEGIHNFVADKPFLFFILDNNLGQILFLGRLMQP